MKDIKCPQCGQVFKVDEAEYQSIADQVRNSEFESELCKRLDDYKAQQAAEAKVKEAESREAFNAQMQKKQNEIQAREQELAILKDKLDRYEQKGMNRRLYAMVLGIPNVGKSTLINKLSGGKKAKAEDRPGVTKDKQWVSTGIGVDLLDMPGILWPKFEDQTVGEHLAFTGAVKDDILDLELLAMKLCRKLRDDYPALISERFKLGNIDAYSDLDDYDFLCAIGKKRGFLISGGEVNTERTANMVLDEYRSCKIGRITLDKFEN